MDVLACLLCFVIRYFQLQVTENLDSTRSNNEECILSPNKKPRRLGGSRLVYSAGERQHQAARFFQLSVCSGGSAPFRVAGGSPRLTPLSLVSSPWNNQRQVKRTFILWLSLRGTPQQTSPSISQVENGPCLLA